MKFVVFLMQQRIVIRVQLKCQKCRSKAMMIAAKSSGTVVHICVHVCAQQFHAVMISCYKMLNSLFGFEYRCYLGGTTGRGEVQSNSGDRRGS